jgi:hypothetical protein
MALETAFHASRGLLAEVLGIRLAASTIAAKAEVKSWERKDTVSMTFEQAIRACVYYVRATSDRGMSNFDAYVEQGTEIVNHIGTKKENFDFSKWMNNYGHPLGPVTE